MDDWVCLRKGGSRDNLPLKINVYTQTYTEINL